MAEPRKPPDPMNFRDVTAGIEASFEGSRKYLVELLDDAVARCAQESQRLMGKSKMTLTLEFEALGNGEMLVSGGLTAKLPVPKPFAMKAYVDRAGRLLSDDPQQMPLIDPVPIQGGGDR